MKPLLADVALRRVENDYSQFGEGHVISEILERLGVDHGVAVEFGAGDGVELSNTRHLWTPQSSPWMGVLVESNPARYHALVDNCLGFPVAHFEAVVTKDNVNDFVVSNATVVSIDVDGDDYAILSAMVARPKVLCVEHHPMIPPHVSLVAGEGFGCSALALKEWGDENGYRVVAMTNCNTIMVPQKYDYVFDDVDLDFLHMFDPTHITWALSNVHTGDYAMIGTWPFGRGSERA